MECGQEVCLTESLASVLSGTVVVVTSSAVFYLLGRRRGLFWLVIPLILSAAIALFSRGVTVGSSGDLQVTFWSVATSLDYYCIAARIFLGALSVNGFLVGVSDLVFRSRGLGVQ